VEPELARRGDLGRAQAAVTLDVVTGAFSYTGRHIAEALLERGRSVRTLTRKQDPTHPLADRVERAPLVFDASLTDSLRGAETLYNTYWVRFERGETTFDQAVANTRALFAAAREAGVRRIVHISVANADASSPYPYFRAKAAVEEALRDTGLSHAIVRPTIVYGPDDILVNNIAWALRHVPVFLVAGDGRYEVQPVSVHDVARLCVEGGERDEDTAVDAAGPERWAFTDFIGLIRSACRGWARIAHAPPALVLATGRAAGLVLRDVIATGDELEVARAGLLVSHEPALGTDSFESWVRGQGRLLGRRYVSEVRRNYAE
jgi:nucleoside-diphosphate-sugar epimerase